MHGTITHQRPTHTHTHTHTRSHPLESVCTLGSLTSVKCPALIFACRLFDCRRSRATPLPQGQTLQGLSELVKFCHTLGPPSVNHWFVVSADSHESQVSQARPQTRSSEYDRSRQSYPRSHSLLFFSSWPTRQKTITATTTNLGTESYVGMYIRNAYLSTTRPCTALHCTALHGPASPRKIKTLPEKPISRSIHIETHENRISLACGAAG
jgi:hypothetical protein